MHASPAAAASLPGRDRILIRCCVLAVAALAWLYLLYLDGRMARIAGHGAMPGMGMSMGRAWDAGEACFAFVMWVVMMTGMMAGSALPVMLLFAGAQVRRQGHGALPAVLMFGLGYALAWTGFSAIATLAQWTLHDAAMLSQAMAASSSWVGGAILCAAGAYQLTPFKRACLMHCRSPLGFLMAHWRDGRFGALQMGMRHGAYCLGCCWALMGVLFVVGIMNLVWVAALALLVLMEKAGPAGMLVARVAGATLIGAGIFLFVDA